MSSTHFTQISLEALLARAVNPSNGTVDSPAVEAFCTLVNKEKEGPQIGVKVLAARLPFGGEHEVLGILNMLDMCMLKCGTSFQNEVGKFRFLNEMIKLVSPKYLGDKTPTHVKVRVVELMYLWTVDYPKESKIKEAFEMLRKQGVVKNLPNPNIPEVLMDRKKSSSSVFQDQQKSNILKKLLQSKDPEDIQAANWLIKSMVKEDEKLSDLKSKAITDLESVQNNLKLLNEMMNSYRKDSTTDTELDIMKQLYDNCVRLSPNLASYISEKQCPDLLDSVLSTTDEVTESLLKYHRLIILGDSKNTFNKSLPYTSERKQCPHQNLLDILSQGDKNEDYGILASPNSNTEKESSAKVLCDLLLSSEDVLGSPNILKPVSISTDNTNVEEAKQKNGLEDLDFLNEHLVKENLPSSHNRNDKIPMNLLCKINEIKLSQEASASQKNESLNLDLNYLLEKTNGVSDTTNASEEALSGAADNSDDCLVDITEDNKENEPTCSSKPTADEDPTPTEAKPEVKFNEIFVRLQDIKPSSNKSIVAIDDRNGISVNIHLAKNSPKSDVSVYVFTTVNKNELPITAYDMKATVPKGCKLKLQLPSARELAPYNPFFPPAPITQIMLIANPHNVKVHLRFVISFVMDNEEVTDMGEVEDLPSCNGV